MLLAFLDPKTLYNYSSCKNIDLNAVLSTNGYSAFMHACEEGHEEVVKLLLDHSERNHIDLNIKARMEILHYCLLVMKNNKK